ncbi:MAG: phosphodiesterase [Rhodoferax sp.]|uniref:HD-GYP domain-containing protein n=1 Tax=Rhodoferax sp. TaxID=50421 RepID=UPI00261369A3|nr:phosphodiesterase [Rhodoferax sp.]MDD2882554.1 phosphodiesterase [Rhodoferax sp.]
MDLIEFRPELLYIGMSLPFTLRDGSGAILLAKGQKIDSPLQLTGIQSRPKIFVEIDETDEGVRAMMSGITELNRMGAPIKDFSKYLGVRPAAKAEDKEAGTLSQRWGDVESKLGGLLASVQSTSGFDSKIGSLEDAIGRLLGQDIYGSQFLLFNRAVTHFGGYSALHSLLCAALVNSLASPFGLSDDERRSLVCAALTMNVAMTHLQDLLALQKGAPSPSQRNMIDTHSVMGRQLLVQSGVTDELWLQVVEQHHAALSGPEKLVDWPVAQRMTRILQIVDRYTAAMSPRKSRAGRNARDSVRSVVLPVGETKHDEVGTALVRLLGVSPPGTFVTLANGETAVVVRRGIKPGEPWVASVINRSGQPIAEPRLRDTAKPDFAVESTLAPTSVKLSLNMELMLKLMPRGQLA